MDEIGRNACSTRVRGLQAATKSVMTVTRGDGMLEIELCKELETRQESLEGCKFQDKPSVVFFMVHGR